MDVILSSAQTTSRVEVAFPALFVPDYQSMPFEVVLYQSPDDEKPGPSVRYPNGEIWKPEPLSEATLATDGSGKVSTSGPFLWMVYREHDWSTPRMRKPTPQESALFAKLLNDSE